LVTATLLPDLIFPSRDGKPWALCWYENFVSKVAVAAAPEAGGAWARWDILNQSLPGTLYRLTARPQNTSQTDVCVVPLSDSQLRFVTFAFEAFVVGIIGLAVWPRRIAVWTDEQRSFATLGQFGVVLCGMLLLSPMSSKHHFCTLVVPIAFCVVYVLFQHRDRVVLGGLAAVFLFGTLGAKDLVGDGIGNLLQACGSLAFCTLACLIASSWALFRGAVTSAGQLEDERDDADDGDLPPNAIFKIHSYQKSA
jgi:hypothetical protein